MCVKQSLSFLIPGLSSTDCFITAYYLLITYVNITHSSKQVASWNRMSPIDYQVSSHDRKNPLGRIHLRIGFFEAVHRYSRSKLLFADFFLACTLLSLNVVNYKKAQFYHHSKLN